MVIVSPLRRSVICGLCKDEGLDMYLAVSISKQDIETAKYISSPQFCITSMLSFFEAIFLADFGSLPQISTYSN